MESRIPQQPPIIPTINNGISRPMWSVMIPSFNCIEYLKVAIESVLAQNYDAKNMQIEVVDDCSTDGEVEELVRKIGLGRVTFFRQPYNKGSLRNFESCINRSTGYYIHILHGDDFILNGFYKEIEAIFNLYPSAGAAFTNFQYVDYTNKIINIINKPLLKYTGIIPNFLLKISSKQLIQPPAIVVKRSTYEKTGSFYAVNFGEDWEMWTRIASQYPVVYSPRYLACYRVAHGIGISYNSFLSGQNISDIIKVINIIQNYLPLNKRRNLKQKAFNYYSIYIIKVANSMLVNNPMAAFVQLKGAINMSKSLSTYFWAVRFLLMYIMRFKQVKKKITSLIQRVAK